jgi:hypothetical protein
MQKSESRIVSIRKIFQRRLWLNKAVLPMMMMMMNIFESMFSLKSPLLFSEIKRAKHLGDATNY